MRRDGSLTRDEARTVERALEIVGGWVEAHLRDGERPYGWSEIAQAHDALSRDAWCMLVEVDGDGLA